MSTATTPFTHTPRPPVVPEEAVYSQQRRYGHSSRAAIDGVLSVDEKSCVELFALADGRGRYRGRGYAEMTTNILNQGICARITINLSASGLYELARNLIDAAHDIEQRERGAAP